ncbi:MAG: alpha/beta hydrolase, partial [Peptostreptococcaceae bacterium]
MINKLEREYFTNFGENKEKIQVVEKKLNRIKKSGYFKGQNNIDIYYEKYVVEKEGARIVISHGFCECLEKYKELIYYFVDRGYSVFGFEHRGHGRSGHLSKKYKSQVNIEKFDYYVEDLKEFIDEVVMEEGKDLYLYAHSMGGAIGTLFLETYPGYFKRAILNAPMIKINTGNYSNYTAGILAKIYVAIGKGDEYVFGHKDFDGRYNLEGSGTSDKNRYKNHLEYLLKNEICQRGGGSFRWINESLKATKKLLR